MKISAQNVKIHIGEVIDEDDEWKEKMGPTPKPGIITLREWDRKLLSRYEPKYHTYIKECQFCAYGPCDLSKGRRGACGMSLEVQMARENMFLAITGAAAHAAHARHVLDYLVEKFGKDFPMEVAENSEIHAPWFRTIVGKRPKTLADIDEGLSYEEEQLTHLLSSLHMGQESSDFDFNSKALHAGMLDHLGMEIADMIQIAVLGFPKGAPDPGFCEIGLGTIDKKKPVVLCIGHNVCGVTEIIDYAKENKHDVEIGGICCTAIDMTRYDNETKIVGQLSYQLPFVRSGVADVIIIDEQCIRVDTVENAEKLGIPVISTSDKCAAGFVNMEEEDSDKIARELVLGGLKGCFIPNLEKVGEVAVKTALLMKKEGRKGVIKDAIKEASNCVSCGICSQACPIGNDVKQIISSINYHFNNIEPKAVKGKGGIDIPKAVAECVVCGVCTQNCPQEIDVSSIIESLKEGKTVDPKLIADCVDCGLCFQNCPKDINIPAIFAELRGVTKGKEEVKTLTKDELMDALSECLFCGRCESWCPKDIPIVSVFSEVYKERFENDKAKIRVGRGAIQDTEIRKVGSPIVMGEIPGIVAPVGCALWPHGGKELGVIIEEFLKRNYIVAASGCSAMALATDYSGEPCNLYEKYGGEFDGGNLINVGSCVSNPHITGAAMKVASIFAKRPLRGNFEEIADYILNRVGAVGLVWGTMSQKAVSIGSGCMRVGVPVIWGPSGVKYRKELLSEDNTNWEVYDTRTGEKYDVGPVPEHLSYVAKTKEEVMSLIPKLCMRASDGIKGRQIKLAHYMDIHEKCFGKLPDDLHKFVRTEADIPLTERERIHAILDDVGWKPVKKIPDPTLVKRLCKTK
ncbi:MAG: 4Fe-4S dicluster domain-containing protein [Candidatus Altiarchaeota archaeon]|nr:4Fe-4S dicluster domain-containing protein [Candidatus Altiarchaeota archaeon]